MDTNVAGLNKVYCFTNSSSYNGKTVSITDGINTWLEVLDELSCVFQIPSIPAPAKRRYTVTLHNGDETQSALYQRVIDLGFGDSVRIGLYQNDEIVTVGSVPKATSGRIGGIKAVNSSSTQYGVYMNGDYLQLRTADASYIGGVKVSDSTSNGLYMSNGGIYLRTASTTQKGGVKVGDSLDIDSNGVLNRQTNYRRIVTAFNSSSGTGDARYTSIQQYRVSYTSDFTYEKAKTFDCRAAECLLTEEGSSSAQQHYINMPVAWAVAYSGFYQIGAILTGHVTLDEDVSWLKGFQGDSVVLFGYGRG